MKRFVVLQHTLSDMVHWDLMFDIGDVLATWQSPANPVTHEWGSGACLQLRRIGDHRRVYLDYEGPVSGERGQVQRADEGEYFLLVRQPELWTVRLAGRFLVGTYLLSMAGTDRAMWQLQFLGR